MKDKREVYEKLQKLDVAYTVQEHKAVYTIEEMQLLGLEKEETVIKNLFIRDDKKQNYYLILLEKGKKVSLKQLKEALKSRPLSFASEEDLERILGLKKGSVTPLGIWNDREAIVKVVMDSKIKEFKEVGVHPLENTATVWIKWDDLIKIIEENGNEVSILEME